MKQKLISIYLCDSQSADSDQREHLNEYLEHGWMIRSITPLNGSGGGNTDYSAGWVIVLLEKA